MGKTTSAAPDGAALVTIDALLSALDGAAQVTAPVVVELPEFGCSVYVARLSTAEWLNPEANGAPPAHASEDQRRGWSVARWVSDATGKRLVAPDNLAALDRFAALPWATSLRILVAAGVMEGDEEKKAPPGAGSNG